jgi:hypothetical protein
VGQLFRWLGSHFSDCTSFRFELIAAGVSGDLAYTTGYEHTSASWDGAPMEPYVLRVTHAYRREDGEWEDRPPPCRFGHGRSGPTRRVGPCGQPGGVTAGGAVTCRAGWPGTAVPGR